MHTHQHTAGHGYVIHAGRFPGYAAHGGTIRPVGAFDLSGTTVLILDATMAPGSASAPEYHDVWEIVQVLEGVGRLEVGGKSEPFGPGDTLFLPAEEMVPHQVFNTGSRTLHVLLLFPGRCRSFAPTGEELPLPPWMSSLVGTVADTSEGATP